jgi:Flp pilus assembly protein TadD
MQSQFRCILFALIALPAACGGDRSTPTTGKDTIVPRSAPAAVATPAPVPTPEPARPSPVEPASAVAAPTTYSETVAAGKAAAVSGDHAHAREMFEAAIQLDKKAAEPHIELARLFIATGERHLAISAAHKAVKLAPTSQAYNTLGRAELARFNYDSAIAAFTRATELAPDNVWAWNNLGYTYLSLKNYQAAVEALVEATTHKGTEGYMWNNLGTAYEQLDELDLARLAYENGGKLGSKEAIASRKRLDGVKTIVVMSKPEKPAKADAAEEPNSAKPAEQGYDLSEPMPAVDPAGDASGDGAEVTDDATGDDAAEKPAQTPAKPAEAPTKPVEKPTTPSVM